MGIMVSFWSLVVLLLMVACVTAGTMGEHQLGWVPMRGVCEGSIEECMLGEGDTMEMSRRILATSQYISYKALQSNTVPCSQRGASYYNCQPGAQANPYTRGCTTITRCRTNQYYLLYCPFIICLCSFIINQRYVRCFSFTVLLSTDRTAR